MSWHFYHIIWEMRTILITKYIKTGLCSKKKIRLLEVKQKTCNILKTSLLM